MRIITGYIGEPHIASNDDQSRHRGETGPGNYAFNVGSKFAVTIDNYNEITIGDGEGLMQGVHFRVDPSTYDSIELDNGTQGKKRIDLICAHYEKDSTTQVESMTWKVIKGTESSGTPAVPAHETGDIRTGASSVDAPWYKVTYDGLSISSIVPLFEEIPSVSEMISEINSMAGIISGFQTLMSSMPTVLKWGSGVNPGTSSNDITIYTIPAAYDPSRVVASVTNGAYNTNKVQMISTYIDDNRRVHARIDQSTTRGFYRYNYIIWYLPPLS